MHPWLNIAIRAARKAGDVIMRHSRRLDELRLETKPDNSIVTQADTEAEQAIIDIVKEAYPEHGFLGEEFGEIKGEEDVQWVIDPIDGTNNFVRGHPMFAVSIAIREKGVTQHAVVYHPMTQEIFAASRGKGAYLDQKRIRITERKTIKQSTIDMLVASKYNKAYLEKMLALYKTLADQHAKLPMVKVCALQLAYVACGRLDAGIQFYPDIWDIAAGELIVREAGGLITSMTGGTDYLECGHLLAANSSLHRVLLEHTVPAMR